jgi:hypothetical protein
MTRRLRLFPLLAVLIALGLGVASQAGDEHCRYRSRHKVIPFDEISFFFELNATDEDLGVQLDLDGEPWKRLMIFDPCGRKILDVSGHDSLKEFGLSSLFFESNEPSFDEMPADDILDLFPEGKYRFVGRTVEGDRLLGTAMLTHDLPGAPVILTPEEDDVVDPEDVEITWSPVTTPAGIEIESYQVIVTNDEDPRFECNVRLPADATSLTVPAEFFAPDTEYELEILAVEESGNQTISVIFFRTEE